ncbi:hypothetical protein QWY75_07860 [Pontixanthobacter aestiaquae]|uniref:Uncharacterized protein n=1 Tax=Pontixanthobacter aestiaquae TaxID=1509367 RepID=A0A844Z566_9SPHN|nr:hypothetical protein [Pontixanthobacter aestiaquae]MDN3646120.1 hypothetical protein [Pontixanthobacter aestiaquae]MXO82888.1 hypothetical protein [Pontixanthobacter aestiaquae]
MIVSLPTAETARNYGQPITLASHQALWMTALAHVPVPEPVAELLNTHVTPRTAIPMAPSQTIGESTVNHWSLDAWLFWRPSGAQGPTAGPLPASFGGSQAGAVLRYRFAPNSRHSPNAYARATNALSGGKETDLAFGLSALMLPKLPISVHAEIRASRTTDRTEIRPAAFVVTEIPPLKTPLGTQVSTYGQAGYVGGEFATSFVDGHVKLDRELADFDLAKLRIGAGTWGGA